MPSKVITWAAIVGWMAIAGVLCWNSWPVLPLDLSAGDIATAEAYRRAQIIHAASYAALAIIPAVLALIVAKILTRARR